MAVNQVSVNQGVTLAGSCHAAPQSLYDFTVTQYGTERTLEEFKGQVTVVLNIASQ